MDIAEWLGGLGLGQYEAAFRDNDIYVELLPSLTADDLRDLGIASVGHRRRILDAAAKVGVAAEAAPDLPSPVPDTPEHVTPSGAERRQLTVMFVDLVDSTALTNRLDPEETRDVLRRYQEACAAAVASFEGHVAKFMGDGVIVYFGYPCAHEDDAERAVRAGIEVVRAIAALASSADLNLQVRIGIATGLVVVGDLIGEGAAQEEAVTGETPNLAGRLQGLAGPGDVILSQVTRQLVGGRIRCTDLGPHPLKGFAEPVRAWRVVEARQHEDRFKTRQTGRMTPLVGREHELGLLIDRWQQAKEGEGQVVLLCGEPGLGKSRLMQALREALIDEPHTPVSHFCSPFHQSSALYPIVGLLERAAGLSGEDPPERQLDKLEAMIGLATTDVGAVAPLLADLLAIPAGDRYPPLALSPRRRKEQTFAALLDQLAGLAARQPVLALYEDVHWADPTTLELLDLAGESVQALRILTVITFRPEFRPPWTDAAHVTLLTFNRLSRRHAVAMVERVTAGKPLPAEVLEQIVARTDGVPLYVEEVTKAVLESGLLLDGGDRYMLAGPLPALAIPATLHDSLMARLDRLALVRGGAQGGAVIGREFSFELLAAIVPLAEPELITALAKLVAADLVFQRGLPPDASYVFKHALLQDAAYESLLRSRRQVLHARIAQVLEDRFGELVRGQPETVAHHWANAAVHDRAVDHWTRAGQVALARSAITEAVRHFRAALSDLAKLTESAERDRRELGVQRALGSAVVAAHGVAAPETRCAYERALELSERIGDFGEMFPVLYGLASYHLYAANLAAGRAAANRLLMLAESSDDATQSFYAHRAAGVCAYPTAEFAAARHHLERALALYCPTEHRAPAFVYAFDPHVVCLDYLARSLLPLGEVGAAVRLADEALAEARRLDHRNSLCFTLFYGATVHQQLGDRRKVELLHAQLAEIAGEERFPIWGAGAKVMRGWLAVDAGAPGPGSELIAEGIRDWQATGACLMLPYFEALLAEAAADEGRLDEAAAVLRAALQRADATGELWFGAELHRHLSRTMRAQGERAAARRELELALEIADRQGARFWRLRAAVELARHMVEEGESGAAGALLGPLVRGRSGGQDAPEFGQALSVLAQIDRSPVLEPASAGSVGATTKGGACGEHAASPQSG